MRNGNKIFASYHRISFHTYVTTCQFFFFLFFIFGLFPLDTGPFVVDSRSTYETFFFLLIFFFFFLFLISIDFNCGYRNNIIFASKPNEKEEKPKHKKNDHKRTNEKKLLGKHSMAHHRWFSSSCKPEREKRHCSKLVKLDVSVIFPLPFLVPQFTRTIFIFSHIHLFALYSIVTFTQYLIKH